MYGWIKLGIIDFLISSVIIFDSGNYFVTAEELIYDGNVTVIGLFEIFEPDNGGCGPTVVRDSVMSAEAVKWYFSRLNQAGDLNLNIGFHGYQTCRVDSQAAHIAIDVVSKTLTSSNQTVVGVIGPEFSSEAEVVSPIFSSVEEESRLLTVGYSATSESLNRNTFPNFFRVVPNDNIQVQVMVESMMIMEWNRIAIVYEDDAYGQHAMQSLKHLSETNNICVAYTASINTMNGIDSAEIERICNDMILGDIPPIRGFVFFGTTSTANIFLLKMNGLGVSDVPIGMFSDGINMNLNTFQNQNKFIGKTKGSLITAPTYRVISEFEAHWRAIFTDNVTFDRESETNPWLKDVFADIHNCDPLSPCEFIPLTDNTYNSSFPQQPLYIQYALMAAHTIAKTLKTVYQSYCPDSSTPCDFVSEFRQGHMIDTMKNVRLNFATDFSLSFDALADVEMTFEETGEPKVDATTASYQLFNLRHVNIDDGEVTFVKVGDYTNDQMTLEPNDVIDYPNDAASTWPSVRKGQCGSGQTCGECIPTDLPFAYFLDPGDLYIIGLVPVYDKSGTQDCDGIRPYHGYQLVEAIRFAANKFNDPNGVYSEYFQGAKVGVIVLNTCNNPAVIERKILNLHKEGLRLANGSVINMEKRILGYVGPLASEIAIAVSRVLVQLRKVSIAYASTSSELNDRDIYKYFMRVVSPVNEQAKAMSNILKELDVNYVQVLYSEDAYGEGALASLRISFKENHICIIQAIKVPEADNFYQYYDILRKYPHAKMVIVFLRSHVVAPVMQTLTSQMSRGEFLFMGSQAWALNEDILQSDTDKNLLGSFSIVLELAQNKELLANVQQQIKPQSYSTNPWSLEYIQTKWQCHYNTSYDKHFSSQCEENYSSDINLDSSSTAAYFSALSMLIGSGSFLSKTCGPAAIQLCDDYLNNPLGLVEETQAKVELDIHGNGINQRMFNDNGNGNIGYTIYNIQQKTDNPQLLEYKRVGQYPVIGTLTFDKSLVVYPTGTDFTSRCPNEQACAGCIDSTVVSSSESDGGGLSAAVILLLVLFLICFTAAVVLAVLLYRLRKDQQIYLTPTPGGDYHEMPPATERQGAYGDSPEPCTEKPHRVPGEPYHAVTEEKIINMSI